MAEIPVVARSAIALTAAVQRALAGTRDHTSEADFLFLERWEQAPIPGAAAAMRINQIRRANPGLAAEVRAELRQGRPLTGIERDAIERAALEAALIAAIGRQGVRTAPAGGMSAASPSSAGP
jgi:hypothetical protein